MQSLMLHNILVRKKSILDQFRGGLSILGLLDEIQRSPQLSEDCFVHKEEVNNELWPVVYILLPPRMKVLIECFRCSTHSFEIAAQMILMTSLGL